MNDEGTVIPVRLLSPAAIGSEVVIEQTDPKPQTFRGVLTALTGEIGQGGDLVITTTLRVRVTDEPGNVFDLNVAVTSAGQQPIAILGAPMMLAADGVPGSPESDAPAAAGYLAVGEPGDELGVTDEDRLYGALDGA